jgi:diguanylate cyclase (GGDEF)-like protein
MPLSAPHPAAWDGSMRKGFSAAGVVWGVTLIAVMAGALLTLALVSLWPDNIGAAAAGGGLLAALPLALMLLRLSREWQRDRMLALMAGATDPVTGVMSRASFMVLAEREFARARRYGVGAGLLLVDVDGFGPLRDSHGVVAGDLLLREVAANIQATLRAGDALARFGAAQVAVFLVHADPMGVLDVAERIRDRIDRLEVLWHDRRLRVTVSVGAALIRPAHLSLQAVIDDVEAAQGVARQAGGNCVRTAPVDALREAQPGRGRSVDGSRQPGS